VRSFPVLNWQFLEEPLPAVASSPTAEVHRNPASTTGHVPTQPVITDVMIRSDPVDESAEAYCQNTGDVIDAHLGEATESAKRVEEDREGKGDNAFWMTLTMFFNNRRSC
jgi:hypothetical protein